MFILITSVKSDPYLSAADGRLAVLHTSDAADFLALFAGKSRMFAELRLLQEVYNDRKHAVYDNGAVFLSAHLLIVIFNCCAC